MALPNVIQQNLAPFLRQGELETFLVERRSAPSASRLALRERSEGGRRLHVEIPDQKMGNWCWAAVAAGIATAFGEAIEQCEIASSVQRIRCCSNPPDEDANQVQPLSPALSIFGHDHFGGFLSTDETAPLLSPSEAWQYLTDHIDRGLPVPVRIAFGERDVYGHFVCVTGYETDGSARYVIVGDPGSDRWYFAINEFISGYLQDGRWDTTYELTPAGVIEEL
jgi:hypothetical protein